MASQFSTAKNPPWARTDLIQATASSTPGNAVNPAMISPPGVASHSVYSISSPAPTMQQQQFNAQQLTVMGLQPQQAMQQPSPQQTVLSQPGIAIPTSLTSSQVATVSYPLPRTSQIPGKQRVFTGTITKLHDNFGFVDEDVFFQTSCCVKGPSPPKAGARVLVEATYNANMPFKWNATRIQVLPNQSGNVQNHGSKGMPGMQQSVGMGNQMSVGSMNQVPPPLMSQTPQPSMGMYPGGGRGNPMHARNDGNRFNKMDRDKHREQDRERDRRDRREQRLKRQRSPIGPKPREVRRSRSPIRRRQPRVVPRYVVQIPKICFDCKDSGVITLRSRYPNMYIPSDCFNAEFSWTEAFSLNQPFKLGTSCSFHVMPKDVEALTPIDAVLDPPDADHLYTAKVMLLASPPLEDLYKKSCNLAEDSTETFVHPTRLLQFLVGVRGKNEPMAIGGAWSASLDGADPEDNPQVLIKTAIRTTKALTGLDLSGCTQWYRFAEIRYLRPETTHKGKQVAARVETVVVFMPDVWMCSPTRLDYTSLQAAYAKQLQRKIAVQDGKDVPPQVDEELAENSAEEKNDPTHHALLDPKSMKIIDLRRELESRTLSSKGLKSQLIARLTKTIKQEKEDETELKNIPPEPVKEEIEEEEDKDTEVKKEEENKKRKEKHEKASLERKYALPDHPAIIIHPSPTAKSGKFDCSLMSLSVLLDYRPEDNKEHSFEVSLFAELFNEMLMRDFGFHIYKMLFHAPAIKEEDKEKKDKKEEKDEKKEEKKEKNADKEGGTPSKKRKTEDEEKSDDKDKTPSEDKKASEDGKDEEMEEGDEYEEGDKNDDEDSDKKDKDKKDKDKKKEKKKFVTVHPDLLLSFVYFDQNHTGYLLDKDLEEMFQTLGLHLSRAQIKKLVQKVISRDTFNYRKFTDKPVSGSETDAKEEKIIPITNGSEDLSIGNIEMLLKSKTGKLTCDKAGTRSASKKDQSSNIVNYKGALLDIDSLMHRLDKSEHSRTALEKKLEEMTAEIFAMKSNLNNSEFSEQKLTLELRQVKTDLENKSSMYAEADKCNKKWTKVVTECKNLMSTAMNSMNSVLNSDTTSVKQETE